MYAYIQYNNNNNNNNNNKEKNKTTAASYRVFGMQVSDQRLESLVVVDLHQLGVLPPESLGVQDAPSVW